MMSEDKAGLARAEDGVGLHYEYFPAPGDGPTIILCNGILCTTNYWVYMIEHFRGRYPLLLWDYRGHGKSEIPEDFETVSIPQHARDLAAIMDHLGIDDAVLVGFSMGVQAIFEFYRQFPGRVRGLVMMSGGAHKPFNLKVGTDKLEGVANSIFNFAANIAPILELPLNAFLKSPLRMPVARRIGIDPHRAKKKDMIPYFIHIANLNKRMGFIALRLMNEHTAMDMLDTIKVPTLIIVGERDGMTPPSHGETVRQKIPNSELFVVPYGQHTALIENPQAVNYRIELYLRDHFNSSVPLSEERRRQLKEALREEQLAPRSAAGTPSKRKTPSQKKPASKGAKTSASGAKKSARSKSGKSSTAEKKPAAKKTTEKMAAKGKR